LGEVAEPPMAYMVPLTTATPSCISGVGIGAIAVQTFSCALAVNKLITQNAKAKNRNKVRALFTESAFL
jgi:hypothetical protein